LGPEGGDVRVMRSGSWKVSSDSLRSAIRIGGSPPFSGNAIGFRCSRSP